MAKMPVDTFENPNSNLPFYQRLRQAIARNPPGGTVPPGRPNYILNQQFGGSFVDRPASTPPPRTTTSNATTSSGTTPGDAPATEPPATEPAPFTAATIPAGGTLIKIPSPVGADEPLYFVEYTVYGVPIRFEIGGETRFKELFGSADTFDTSLTLTQTQVDDRGGLSWGSIDEQLGNKESLQAQVDRGIREAGMEDIPEWQRASTDVMTIIMSAAREGWSAGRTMKEIAGTEAFATRYPGFEAWRKIMGDQGTLSDAISSYVVQEDRFKTMLRRFRGPNTDISAEYVGQLIATGWTDQEVGEVLDFEQRMVGNPDALVNLNEILSYHGMDTVDAVGLLELSRGQGSPEVLEVLNDALRATELERQGIEVSAETASALGQGSSMGLSSQADLTAQAQAVAMDIFANKRELDLGKFGLTESDILMAAFNGEASASVASRLGQLARERAAAAEGFEGLASFQSEGGRLQTVGIGNL